MKLHSLRLIGFKTFGQETKIAFNPGVSAIVGPNGSGKSNVVDAIAWVLGEQTPSILRIKRASELVYQPADGSTAQNMASVELAITEAHNSLPTSGSELTIARTGYRDGESDFYLNGGRTLRKHIRALFAPYGMAQRTFSVIRQGHTDLLLDVNPLNRLRVIQEAAGVLGLIQQKEETIRRLARTEEQLLPVRQELRELQLSMSHLERQARQFEQRQALLSELKAEFAPYFLHHLSKLEEGIASNFAKTEKASNLVEFLDSACQDNRDLRSALRDQYSRAAEQLEELQKELQQTEHQLQLDLRQRDVLEERRKQFSARREAILQHQMKVNLQIDQCIADLEQIQAERRLLDARLKKVRQDVQAKRSKHESLRSQRNADVEQLWSTRKRLTKLDEEIAVVAGELTQWNLDSRLLAQTAEVHVETEESLLLQCEQIKGNLLALEQRKAEIEQQVTSASLAVRDKQTHTREQEEQITKLHQQCNGLDRQLAELSTRKSSWEEYLSVQIRRFSPLSLESLGEGRLMGILGSLLEVPPTYQRPLAACLGDWINGMVFRGWDDACTVLKLRKETQIANVTYIAALDRIAGSTQKLCPLRGFEPLLSSIEYPEELQSLIEVLLADCYVAPDIQAAMYAIDRCDRPEPIRIVSMSGDLFTNSGLIRVNGTSGIDTQLLGMQHEVKKLAADIDQVKGEIRDVSQDLVLASDSLKASRRDEFECQERLVMAELALSQTELEWAELDRSREQLLAQLEKVKEDLALNRSSALELHATTTSSQKVMAKLIEERDAELKISSRLEETLASPEYESWSIELEEASLCLQEVEKEIGQLQERKKQLALAKRKLEEEFKAAQSQENLLMSETESVDEEFCCLEEKLDISRKTLNEKNRTLMPLLHTTRRYVVKQRELDNSYEEQMMQLRSAEAQLHQLEFEQEQLQEREIRLREQMLSDLEMLGVDFRNVPELKPLMSQVRDMMPPLQDQIKEEIASDAYMNRLRRKIARCGSVHEELYFDFQNAESRSRMLDAQLADLVESNVQLREIIQRLDEQLSRKTNRAFLEINRNFSEYFARFFPGGQGWLEMSKDPEEETPGIELYLQLPGKHVQHVAALSGGERAMAALAFICSMLKFNSPPFCVLDEIDAPLDETNVDLIGQTLRELAQRTQLILITHNHRMLEYTDAIWGVTLNGAGCSQVLSMQMEHSLDRIESHA